MAAPDSRYQKPSVQMKRKWDDPWQTELELEVDSWDVTESPARPQAHISYRYGKISDGRGPKESLDPLLLGRGGWFVRVMRPLTEEEIVWAVGAIPAGFPLFSGVLMRPKDNRGDDFPGPTGADIGRCLGLDFLLERTEISTSIFWDGLEVSTLKTALPFNIRDSKTNTLQGNRSTIKHFGGGAGRLQDSYVFSDEDGELWTAHDVVEYLISQFSPVDFNMQLAGSTNLDQYVDAWRPFKNIRQGLNAIINRTRGHSWRIKSTISSEFSAIPFDVTTLVITPAFRNDASGGGVTLRGNRDTVDVSGTDVRIVGTINISDDIQPQFDRLVLLGDPLINMETVDFSDGPPAQITELWSSSLEDDFKAADKDGRKAAKFETVYRAFGLTTSLLNPGPTVQSDGTLTTDVTPTQSFLGKTLLRNLPMLKTDDDGGTGPAEFRRPLLYVEMPDATFVPLDKLDTNQHGLARVTVKMLSGQMGVMLGGSAGKNHLYGLGHYAVGAPDTEGDTVAPKFDFENIKATIAWASSERLRVVAEFQRDNAAGIPRTKVIEVPGAQAWWRAPGTTVDVVDGQPVVEEFSAELRNDRDRLNAILTFVKAWREPHRRTCSIAFRGTVDDYKVGQILRNITGPFGSTAINTVISRVTYDAVKGTTTVQTAFSELDFGKIAGQARGRAGIGRQGLSFPSKPAIGASHIGQDPENLPAEDMGSDTHVIAERGQPTGAFTGGTTITLNPVDKDDDDIAAMANVVCHLAPDKSFSNASYGTSDTLAFTRYEGNDGEADGVVLGQPSPLISGLLIQYVEVSPDGSHKTIRKAYDNRGVLLGFWDSAGLNWTGRKDAGGTPIPEPTAPTYTIEAM